MTSEERSDRWYQKKARAQYHVEGCTEVDPHAPVSRGDPDGAYVQAWVWVDAEVD